MDELILCLHKVKFQLNLVDATWICRDNDLFFPKFSLQKDNGEEDAGSESGSYAVARGKGEIQRDAQKKCNFFDSN